MIETRVSGFRLWAPGLGHTESQDGIFYHATPGADVYRYGMPNFQRAAEHFAEHHCRFTDQPFVDIEIFARDMSTAIVHAVTVRAETHVAFVARFWHAVGKET